MAEMAKLHGTESNGEPEASKYQQNNQYLPLAPEDIIDKGYQVVKHEDGGSSLVAS
ncbi:hypothetical protein GCM10008090_20370 [Arenicella chitinivorans]|uniref:Uncharacterized protein n=1 Tax=Arenicella chitinivorans TaxID=1329800 RepID=A0A918RTK0_9GAMM|nr:hypothetical protein GCM10008090_20370 [Arenicella chitinivorans]